MSYATVETGLLTMVRIHANYNADNSAIDNYNILSNSRERSLIISGPGSFSREVVAAPRRISTLWTINMDLFVPLRQDRTTLATNIRTELNTLLSHVDQYPTLNSVAGVVNAMIEGGDDPVVWTPRKGGGGFWMIRLNMQVIEAVNVTISE